MTPGPVLFAAADRRAVRSVAVQFFVNGAVVASYVSRLPEIRDRVGVSVSGIGLIMSVAGISGLLGSALVGPAIRRWTTRWVMIAGGVLLALTLVVVGVAESWLVLLGGLILISVFDVFADVAMNLQGAWLSARRPTSVMSRLHGLWSLGTLVGGIAASRAAAAGISITTHLLVASAVLVAVLGYVGPGLLRADESPAPLAAPGRAGVPRISRAAIVAFTVAGATAVGVEMAASDWAAFRLSDDLGASAGLAALAYVAVMGGMTVGRFAGDSITGRIGDDRLVSVSLPLIAVGLVAVAFAPWVPVVLGGYLLAGLGAAALLPAVYFRAAHHPGPAGSALGALTAGIRVAALAVPLTVGALARGLDHVGWAVAVVTLPSVAGFVAVTWWFRRDSSRPASELPPAS